MVDSSITPRARIDAAQIMRAVAALLVVLLHAEHEIGELARRAAPIIVPFNLGIGVDIFFVISGFIMVVSTQGAGQSAAAAGQFLLKRAIRILPLYWLFTVAMIAAMLILPRAFSNASLDPRHIALSFLLLPHEHPAAHTLEPALRVGWTLIYEMFFYALFALSLLAPRRIGLVGVVAALVGLTVGGMVLKLDGLAGFYTSSIILEFVYGIGLALLWSAKGRPGFGLAVSLFAAAAGAYFLFQMTPWVHGVRGLAAGVPAVLLVAAALATPAKAMSRGVGPLLQRVGDSSYSLYLSHIFTIGAIKVVASRLAPLEPWPLFVCALLSVAVAAAVGHAVHLTIERPMLRWLQRTLVPRRPSPAAALAEAAAP